MRLVIKDTTVLSYLPVQTVLALIQGENANRLIIVALYAEAMNTRKSIAISLGKKDATDAGEQHMRLISVFI